MRVLDIDLDFFLDDIAHYQNGHGCQRLSEDHYNRWAVSEVQTFLENQCGLSTESPISGRIFTHHHEVFYSWRESIQNGRLTVPFDVVHIDAHSDTGNGDWSCEYLMSEILDMPVDKRMYPKEDKNGFISLGAGNYLAFALACRWIKSVTFVTPQKWSNDLGTLYCKNFDPESGSFQLKKYNAEQIEELVTVKPRPDIQPLDVEPEVPYCIVSSEDFQSSGDYSFMSLTQSPSFTPLSSDELIPVILKYINR